MLLIFNHPAPPGQQRERLSCCGGQSGRLLRRDFLFCQSLVYGAALSGILSTRQAKGLGFGVALSQPSSAVVIWLLIVGLVAYAATWIVPRLLNRWLG
jgi:hypothetical protein